MARLRARHGVQTYRGSLQAWAETLLLELGIFEFCWQYVGKRSSMSGCMSEIYEVLRAASKVKFVQKISWKFALYFSLVYFCEDHACTHTVSTMLEKYAFNIEFIFNPLDCYTCGACYCHDVYVTTVHFFYSTRNTDTETAPGADEKTLFRHQSLQLNTRRNECETQLALYVPCDSRNAFSWYSMAVLSLRHY